MPKPAHKTSEKAKTQGESETYKAPLPRPVVQDYTTDWQGALLSNAVLARTLIPGCHVRLVLQQTQEPPSASSTAATTNGEPRPAPFLAHGYPASEAIYFRITKIKDGTFWGTSLDTYRLMDWVGIPFGAEVEIKWRREHINEIPLEGYGEMRQPKRWVRVAERELLEKKTKRGFAVTGLRGAGLV